VEYKFTNQVLLFKTGDELDLSIFYFIGANKQNSTVSGMNIKMNDPAAHNFF